jgi:hypothetical protein
MSKVFGFGLSAIMTGCAAILGNSSRRRRSVLQQSSMALLAVGGFCAALVTASPSWAVLLYYDPFLIGSNPAAGEYTLGPVDPTQAVGDGQNPTIGPTPFFAGAWESPTLPGNQLGHIIQAEGLSYRGVPAPGGSLIAGDADARVGRYIQTKWTASTTGTYYLSFFVNYGTLAAPGLGMGYRTVEFLPENGTMNDDDGRTDIGFNEYYNALGPSEMNATTAHISVVIPGAGTQILSNSPDSFVEDGGITHLVVFKYTLSESNASDIVAVFLDPTNAIEPIVPSAAATDVNVAFNGIRVSVFGGNGVLPAIDEIRVGTTYIDVLPHFPLPGDTNGDDLVDLVDYNTILSHLNLTGQTVGTGDVTGDGKVTIADYRLWKENRTDTSGSGSSHGVPEPTAFLMVLLGVVASLFVRVR